MNFELIERIKPLNLPENIDGEVLIEIFCELQHEFGASIKEISDESFDLFEKAKVSKIKDKQELISAINFSFEVVPAAVGFSILLRDSIFYLQKTILLSIDNCLTDLEMQAYIKKSKDNIKASFDDFYSYLMKITESQHLNNKESRKVLRKLKLKNPVFVYQKHINMLLKQTDFIIEKHELLLEACSTFGDLKTMLQKSTSEGIDEFKTIKNAAFEVKKLLEEGVFSGSAPEVLIENLKLLESEIQYKYHLEEFNTLLSDNVHQLPDIKKFPISIEGGDIILKEINFKKRLSNWLEKSIFPNISEIWELIEVNSNGLKMSLRTIISQLQNITPETQEIEKDRIKYETIEYLSPFFEKNDDAEKFINELVAQINESVRKDIKLSQIYNQDSYFLNSGVEADTEKSTFRTLKPVRKVNDFIVRKKQGLKDRLTIYKEKQTLGDKEKIIKYMQGCRVNNLDNRYNSFFITKGYYGDTFLIKQKAQEKQLLEVYKNRKEGYSGSVLILGKRLSGKTAFGMSFASEYFANNTLRRVPGTKFIKDNVSFDISYDLGKTLNLIIKNFRNDRPLIFLDDLELWWDNEYTLANNLKALRTFLDKYSDVFFVIGSINSATKSFIDEYVSFENIFQAVIHMPSLGRRDAQKLILQRHFATQYKVAGSKGREYATRSEIRKMISTTNKAAEGVIGQTLFLWSLYTETWENQTIKFNSGKTNRLPDFINNETGVLLGYIYLQKHTTEIRLRKMFGPSFSEKYNNILKRLFRLKILVRNLDGQIEINEFALHEVGRLLAKKKFINY